MVTSITFLRGIVEAKLLPSKDGSAVAETLLDVDDLPDGWRSGGSRTYRNGLRHRSEPWAVRARRSRLDAYVHGFHEGRGKLGGGSSNVTVYCDAADAHAAFEFLRGSYLKNPRVPITTFENSRRPLRVTSAIGEESTGDVLAVSVAAKGTTGQQFVLRWRQERFICAVSLAGEAGRFEDDDVLRLARVQEGRLADLITRTGNGS